MVLRINPRTQHLKLGMHTLRQTIWTGSNLVTSLPLLACQSHKKEFVGMLVCTHFRTKEHTKYNRVDTAHTEDDFLSQTPQKIGKGEGGRGGGGGGDIGHTSSPVGM